MYGSRAKNPKAKGQMPLREVSLNVFPVRLSINGLVQGIEFRELVARALYLKRLVFLAQI